MLERGLKALRVPKKLSRPILITGIGALLLGATAPFVGVVHGGLAKPQSITSGLTGFKASTGVDAFPSRASNALACEPPTLASPLDGATAVPPLIGTGAGLGPTKALIALGASQLEGEAWPNIHQQARLAQVPILMYHDVLPQPEVSFDLTPEQIEAHLNLILAEGLTPVSLDQVVRHLRTGKPLPQKPVLLTFDDGYIGHFQHVYPLLKKYQVPAVFSVFPGKLDGTIVGRSTVTWEQLKEMAADPLVTIASHSVTHPENLTQLSDQDLWKEVADSKARLEAELSIPIKYFTYPAGYYDERVEAAVAKAGYFAALTMRQEGEKFAGESESLLAIERFGQSNLTSLLDLAWGGEDPAAQAQTQAQAQTPIQAQTGAFDFSAPVQASEVTLEEIPLAFVTGGRPVTIHADSRYQVPEILAKTNAIAGVDGGFFSLEFLDSNVMIGPVLSQSSRTFIPGNPTENPRLNNRPLVLITPNEVKFIPFDAAQHNTLRSLHKAAPGVTDAFVAAAWLVKDGVAQPASSFGSLFDYDANRHRAFWGVNQAGQPVVGVARSRVDSVTLGRLLVEIGLRDAVMVDSGASTSLAFQGQSLVEYTPRPVPHVVALIPPEQAQGACPLAITPDVPTLATTP